MAFGQLCSINASILANTVDHESGSTVNDSHAVTADISVYFTNGIDGMQATKAVRTMADSSNYSSVGNAGSVVRNINVKETAESFAGHGIDTSFA